jgi:hypothetical protein
MLVEPCAVVVILSVADMHDRPLHQDACQMHEDCDQQTQSDHAAFDMVWVLRLPSSQPGLIMTLTWFNLRAVAFLGCSSSSLPNAECGLQSNEHLVCM